MVDHTVKGYDNELDTLDRRIAEMGGTAEKMCSVRSSSEQGILPASTVGKGSLTPSREHTRPAHRRSL